MFLALGTALSAPVAFAASLGLSVAEDGMTLATATSNTGSVLITGALGDFNINTITGAGVPVTVTPEIDLNTINVASGPLSTSHTLTITLEQSGLTSLLPTLSLVSGYTADLTNISNVVISTYIDPTDSGVANAGDLLTTSSFAGLNHSYSKDVSGTATVSGPFSETEIITAVFAPGSSDLLNGSALLTPAATVPEPAALGLIGVGLMGLSMLRRRR